MYPPCDPTPPCPPPPCPPSPCPPPPAPESYNPSEYQNNPFATDSGNTNAVGPDTTGTSGGGTIINDSGLGSGSGSGGTGSGGGGDTGGGGGGGDATTAFGGIDSSLVKDVVLPVAAAIGVASCLIGLKELSHMVKSIMKTIEKVKANKRDFLGLAKESRELFNILLVQYRKTKDEELKGDIIDASKIFGSLEIFCKEVAEQSKFDRLIHRKGNRRKIDVYRAMFKSARQVLMLKSVVDIRRKVVDDIHPELKEIKASVNRLQERVIQSLETAESSEPVEPTPPSSSKPRRRKKEATAPAAPGLSYSHSYSGQVQSPGEQHQYNVHYQNVYYQQYSGGEYDDDDDDDDGGYDEYNGGGQFYQAPKRPHSWSGEQPGSWTSTPDTQQYGSGYLSPSPSQNFYSNHHSSSSYYDVNHLAPPQPHLHSRPRPSPPPPPPPPPPHHAQSVHAAVAVHGRPGRHSHGSSATVVNNFGNSGNTSVTTYQNSYNNNSVTYYR